MTNKFYIPDTNALLNYPEFVLENPTVLTNSVLRELTTLERKKDYQTLQYQLRHTKRTIRKGLDIGTTLTSDAPVIEGVESFPSMDDLIIEEVRNNIRKRPHIEFVVVTDDILMGIKAEAKGLKTRSTYDFKGKGKNRLGVHEFFYDPESEEDRETLAKIEVHAGGYVEKGYNPFNMVKNQYLVIWDESTKGTDDEGNIIYKEIGTFKFDGTRLVRLKFKNIKGKNVNLKPINVRQRLAFDLLQDDTITVKALTGGQGVGKDTLMLTHAIDMVDRGYYDRIIWLRNNVEMKGTNGIGYLPNGIEDKLRPYTMPVADILGAEYLLDQYIDEGKIVVESQSFIRGRDYKNSIVYVTEAQNNSKEHLKVLLGRVGEGSSLFINGDIDQKDYDYSTGSALEGIQELLGEELVGMVELDKVERSGTSRLAERL